MTEHCQYCGDTEKPFCKAKQAGDCPKAPKHVQSGVLKGLKRLHYGAIYADPAWTFTTRADTGKDRSPEQHYDCMTLEDIKAMPVGDIAAKDCVLFMWVIDTHLEMALDVIKDWGFTYKTRAFEWVKLNAKVADYPLEDRDAMTDKPFFTGMGFWTRANSETCLLATRGRPKRLSASVRRLITSPRREHSRKPDETRDRIEELVAGPYCELFSRSSKEGWDAMGNEIGKFDEPHQIDVEEYIASFDDVPPLTEEEMDELDKAVGALV